jgi:hypothetical protein
MFRIHLGALGAALGALRFGFRVHRIAAITAFHGLSAYGFGAPGAGAVLAPICLVSGGKKGRDQAEGSGQKTDEKPGATAPAAAAADEGRSQSEKQPEKEKFHLAAVLPGGGPAAKEQIGLDHLIIGELEGVPIIILQ